MLSFDVLVAVCALFLEMGRIDETFSEQEMDHVLSILTDKYGLSREHVDTLIEEALTGRFNPSMNTRITQ